MLQTLAAALLKTRGTTGKACQLSFRPQLRGATQSLVCSAPASRSAGDVVQRIEKAQKENRQLRSKLSILFWPRLESFRAAGRLYPLPWHPQAGSLFAPAETHLLYLTGFFDGDGCATASHTASSCALSVTQSYDSGEILLLLQGAFGGGIYAGGGRG